MSERTITVLVVGPQDITLQSVEADFRAFNHLVADGSISSCPLPGALRQQGFYAYCDDDAISRGLPSNRFATHFGHAVLAGPIVLFRASDEGDELSLGVEDVSFLRTYFTAPPTQEAFALAEQNRQFWEQYPSGFAALRIDPLV